MRTLFHITDKEAGIVRCHYCNHEQDIKKVTLT